MIKNIIRWFKRLLQKDKVLPPLVHVGLWEGQDDFNYESEAFLIVMPIKHSGK